MTLLLLRVVLYYQALEAPGDVVMTKAFEGKRGRIWLSLSSEGHAAFEAYVRVLRRIVGPATAE